jgi:hypothetical protein
VQTARRWINQTHPQTLLFGTYLLYFDAFWAVVNAVLYGAVGPVQLLLGGGAAGAAYGIANDKKIAWYAGIAVSGLGLAFRLLFLGLGDAIGLLFAVAQVALLVHPMSRNYVKTWFR